MNRLQELVKNPTTIGVLEFLTGIIATAVDKPASLILSGGRLTQALFKGKLYCQLYSEIHKYRGKGKITDKNLNSKYGKTIFIEIMRAIDEENLDEKKFEALKSIFIKSVCKGTDEHSQMLAYQYFQVCKRLSSLDILVLKTAFDIYKEPKSREIHGGIEQWEKEITKRLGFPRELITESRLKNSGISQDSHTMIFDPNQIGNTHGLTALGVKIGEFIKE